MATVKMVFSARLVDANGRNRSCHAYYQRPDTDTLAQLITALEAFGDDLGAMTDASITRLSASVEDTSYAHAGTGNAPIEQTGVLNFTATGPAPRRWGWAIPAFTNTKLTGDFINLTDADTEVVITELTSGNFTNEVYQPLTSLADAFLSFRRDRKQLQRSSFETP